MGATPLHTDRARVAARPDAGFRRSLLRGMLRVRLVEERIASLYPEQEMRCPIHLSIGQEAAAVGVCAALRPGDWAFSGHRSHGHYLAKGGSLKSMLSELYGKAAGCCGGKGGSMHFIDRSVGFMGATPIVGSTIPIAVGAALGSRLAGEERVVVAFLGDAAVEEGVFHEAANFAVLKKLPVLFLCENNMYSVYSPLSVRQPKDFSLHRFAGAYGMESVCGDGNDVEAAYALTRGALEGVRAGRGPAFIELKTYRWREHCGPNYDNDIGYRTPEEFERWRKLCPLEAFRARLAADGACAPSDEEAMRREIDREVDAAVAFAKKAPYPRRDALMRDIYGKPAGVA